MAKFVGRRLAVGFAKEGTRGTATAPTIWGGRNDFSFNDKTENVREEEGLGRIEDSDAQFVTNKFGEGDISGDLEDNYLGLILTSLLGASPTTTGSGTYTHAYALSNTNTHQSLSIAAQDPNETKIFPLSVINSLEITIEPNGKVEYTANFMSRGGKDWSTLTPSFTSIGNKFLHQHLRFKLAADIASLSGASEISLKALTLTISSNTVKDDVLGTVTPEDILNQQFSVEGEITLNKEDQTYRNYMLDGTYRAMDITLSRSASSSLQFQLPRVDFTEWEPDFTLNEIAKQTIQFKGNYDAANAAAVISTATLINTNTGSNY